MFTEEPCMAQALCGPGDYEPESALRAVAGYSKILLSLHTPLLESLYFHSLLWCSRNGPNDPKTSSLDFNQIHFSQESKGRSHSKPVYPF